MDYERICRWLGLPAGPWPPDHYTLLGLPKGEEDQGRIESQAQEKLKIVRCYQLSHPELATEAMNRLAEAFACLSDRSAKKRYDILQGISPQSSAETKIYPPAPPSGTAHDTVTDNLPTVFVWNSSAPPPVRQADPAPPPVRQADPGSAETVVGPFEVPAEAVPGVEAGSPEIIEMGNIDSPPAGTNAPKVGLPPEYVAPDSILAGAQRSWRQWRGMWSKATLQERLAKTQGLFQAWFRLGRFVASPKRPIRGTGVTAFRRLLEQIDQLREELPSLLGEPGQLGYRVAILARDEDPLQAFQQMDGEERKLLAQDWKISSTLLQNHIHFLEAELRQLHQENLLTRWLRPLRAFSKKYSGWLLALLLIPAFLIAALAIVGIWISFQL